MVSFNTNLARVSLIEHERIISKTQLLSCGHFFYFFFTENTVTGKSFTEVLRIWSPLQLNNDSD